jgi:hypothetical protein
MCTIVKDPAIRYPMQIVVPKPKTQDTVAAAASPSQKKEWYIPDVHAWTPEMKRIMTEEYPNLIDISKQYAIKFDDACLDIMSIFGGADPLIPVVLNKMSGRRTCVDKYLGGVVPAGLFAYVWFEYVRKIHETECYILFKNTLMDMGQTCIQGDTHRLFTILVALDRALKSK